MDGNSTRSGAADRLFRNLAEIAPDALLLVDATDRVVFANASAHTLFGYAPEMLAGLSIELLLPHVHSSFRTASVDAAFWATRADGAKFRAEIRSSPVEVESGWVTAIAVTSLSERERTRTLVASAREAAEKANEAKTRFVAAVSHDLRQPLQALRVVNASLQRQVSDGVVRKVLQQEQRSLDSMSDLLTALLNLSKLDSGTVTLNIADVPLAPVFEDLRWQFEGTAAAKNLRLDIESGGGIFVGTDRALFQDILQNLIGNALRYTDSGEVRVRCERVSSDSVAIKVIDTGIGIAPESLAKIWDDFYQVAPQDAARRGGAGLGLAIVRRIADMLGITVKVSSVVGKGTCFTVEVAGARLLQQSQSDSVAQPAATVVGEGRRIILIDDDDAVRSATSMYLRLDGYSVQDVGSLSELDELLDHAEDAPALVISDFCLKHNEVGSNAIERIRFKYGSSLPAIVLTGDVSVVPTEAFAGTNTRLLDKPTDVVSLTNTISELLNA